MSVIGIDFGNESCYIGVARAGGIETIANDYSLRATPACVAFADKNRIMGVAAANQRVTNMKNTIVGFKRLLGRKYNDPMVQQELRYLPFNVVPQSDGSLGIKVRYLNEEQTFSPEQITAMLFTKLKEIAETALKIKVSDCVISVPSFYTQAERKALLDAAYIAGLNVLRLFNETTSAALAYGIYKQDLPAPEEKPRNVVFVDCGHSSLQVSAAAFNRGKLKMLAAASDANLGGRDIDRILADHFAKEFVSKYKIDASKNARAYLRLSTEVEKLKKQMSANSTKLPLNIECFMDDKDVTSSLQRGDMEEMCAGLFDRVEAALNKCLSDCKLSLDEIYAVEVIGGSTRIPAIKNLIEKVFRQQPSTTLNQDEAVARGCALQCATLSPAIRVREFSVTDIQPFPVSIRWDPFPGGDRGELEVFPPNHPAPFSKLLTFRRKQPFSVEAFYSGITPYPDPYIGRFTIQDVKSGTEKVKVKVRVNLHGIVVVSSATALEPAPHAEQQQAQPQEEAKDAKMETEPAAPVENGGDSVPAEANEHLRENFAGKKPRCDYLTNHATVKTGKAKNSRIGEVLKKHVTNRLTGGTGKARSTRYGEVFVPRPDSLVSYVTVEDDLEDTRENAGAEWLARRKRAIDSLRKWLQEEMDTGAGGAPPEEKKEKRKMKTVDCNVETETHGLPGQMLASWFEAEGQMGANDRLEKERVDAKNSLEEYVYDLRGKLQDDTQLSKYVAQQDLGKLDTQLNDIVNWLYEDGEDCNRQVYSDKLDDLKKLGEPIKTRKIEADLRPTVLEDLARSVQQSFKILDQYRNNDEKYVHIPADDMEKARKETELVEKWLSDQRVALQKAVLFENPPVTVAEIRQHKQNFENIVAPIYNKPKPKVEPPPVAPAETKAETQANGDAAQAQQDQQKMDVDP